MFARLISRLLGSSSTLFLLVLAAATVDACGSQVQTSLPRGDAAAQPFDGGGGASCGTWLPSEGAACNVEGQSCGDCSDVCSWCNLANCEKGRWSVMEVAPLGCETPCGSTKCSRDEYCVNRHQGTDAGPDGAASDGSALDSGSSDAATGGQAQCVPYPTSCEGADRCHCARKLVEQTGVGCASAADNGECTVECNAGWLPTPD